MTLPPYLGTFAGSAGAWDDLTPTANEEAHGVTVGGTVAGAANGTANTTKMSTILDRYHDRALRLAQAKYYQKQVS